MAQGTKRLTLFLPYGPSDLPGDLPARFPERCGGNRGVQPGPRPRPPRPGRRRVPAARARAPPRRPWRARARWRAAARSAATSMAGARTAPGRREERRGVDGGRAHGGGGRRPSFLPAAAPGACAARLPCGARGLGRSSGGAWMRGEARRSRPLSVAAPTRQGRPGGQRPRGGLAVASRRGAVLPAGTLPGPPAARALGARAPPRWDRL